MCNQLRSHQHAYDMKAKRGTTWKDKCEVLTEEQSMCIKKAPRMKPKSSKENKQHHPTRYYGTCYNPRTWEVEAGG